MALREFQDRNGENWKVWNVTADAIDRRTAAEDYMKDWQDGWLCFECADSRRRLASVPAKWEELPDAELEKLLERAQPVKRRMPDETSGEFRTAPEGAASRQSVKRAEQPAAAAARPSVTDVERPASTGREAGRLTPGEGTETARNRIFTDHRGRTFVAALYRLSPQDTDSGKLATSPGTVLRFVSGSLVLDLAEWPDDWDRLNARQLTELLMSAQPADDDAVGDSLPLRRRTDLPG